MKTEQAYVEQDCCIEHEGRTFCAGGATITPEAMTAYLGRSADFDNNGHQLTVTNWHGEALGSARIVRRWPVRSCVTDEMLQVEANIDGVIYTGRCAGIGMSFNGKRKARQ